MTPAGFLSKIHRPGGLRLLPLFSGMQETKEDYPAALESARRAHQVFAALFAADANNHLAKANFALSDMTISRALVGRQRPKEALPLLRAGREDVRRHVSGPIE